MTTVLLHGFWGQPADWNQVLQRLPLTAEVLIPDLYQSKLLSPVTPIADWGAHFWRWVEESAGYDPIQLVGYSMGARLAMTAAHAEPKRVARALFCSGNPQLTPQEAEMRGPQDAEWRQKFQKLPWPELEREWSEQGVFGQTPALERRKSEALREVLGYSLVQWSPRRHAFGLLDAKEWPSRWEWVFGALDQKYMAIAKSLQELPVAGQISIVPQAGHRLIVEAASFIAQWIEKME